MSNINCTQNSNFIQILGNSTFLFFNSSLKSIGISDSNFFNAIDSSIRFDTMILHNILLSTLKNGQIQTCLLESNSNVEIVHSLFDSNIISNGGSLILLKFETNGNLSMNFSIFKNNQGVISNKNSKLLSVLSISSLVYCQMNNVSFINNNGFEGIFDLQINAGYGLISNFTIFDSFSVNFGIHFKNFILIEIDNFTCSNISFTIFSGSCLIIESTTEVKMNYIGISNNFAFSGIAGIIITQENGIYPSGFFFLIYFFEINN